MSTGAHFDFSDSVVLVTGGGTGIGLAITRAFLDAGAIVAVAGRRREPLDEALRGAPADRALAVPTDLADRQQIGDLVDEVVRRFGRLDVVVSNAAGYVNGEITDLEDADWAAMRATNVDGFFHLAKKALPVLAESGGNLVAVSSVSGLAGDWGQAGYNATKAAVSNFVRSLALDWGPRGVRLNAVAPALTRTSAVAAVTENPSLLETFVDRVALGRIGEPEDIAPAVLFLASDAARYVTGVVLPVDGGTSASTGQGRPSL
ncbi:SDR family oxidoreductase [Actinomycetospora sp. NBRC 106378]|uniref:SDR family NAD(P)-dependent oxidoreductase n=1 Tax=Actinomycetospora sp. NBRC 106378 TaxID=3032208 RepID=UPI0024A1F9E7|nr:SDR family oxidoreductase [Actinomycetospora sp. NBRC 106378]GLZ55556.1 3-oxoacyl-ACP reductase [Actinomycetospora sp. NBRC 106378]